MGDLTRHFSKHEFACKCGCGLNTIDLGLVYLLERVRQEYGGAIIVTSGCRCPKHNVDAGGKPDSAHLPHENNVCKAVDIKCESSWERYKLVSLLDKRFQRIGIGSDFIHVDVDKDKPSPVMWIY